MSVAHNQGILKHFLFFDRSRPHEIINNIRWFNDIRFLIHDASYKRYYTYRLFVNTYFPHRTKTTLLYCFNGKEIKAKNQQIEIDLTIEYDRTICIFEAKNGTPKDFNVCQIYHPFLYYYNSGLKIKQIKCVYLVHNKDSLKLWLYTFNDPLHLDSIQFLKSCEYFLVRK